MSKRKATKARAKQPNNTQHDISKAFADLAAAIETHGKADVALAAAEKRKSDAVTLVNKAQRIFDSTVTAIKGTAPHSSDWAKANGAG